MPRPRKNPKKRRADDTGPIKTTDSKTRGTRFTVQAYVGLRPDGKPNRPMRTFDSKQEADQWLKEVTSPSQKVLKIDHRRRRLGTVAEAYIDSAVIRESHHQLRPNTLTDYKRVHTKIIKLNIAMIYLEKLTEDNVLGALTDIKNGKVGKASEQDANRLLKQLRRVLAFAVKKKWIAQNVALTVEPIKIDRLERPVWNSEEVRRFMEEAKRQPQHHVLFYFALSYAPRIGEVMALRWRDMDLDNRTFRINYSYDSKHGEGPPKHGSRRTIHITSTAVRVLRGHRQQQLQEQERKGKAWQDLDLVFPSAIGTHLNPSNIRRVFDRIIELTGLPSITLHDLRHTSASGMIRRGNQISLVSEVLGHKDASMTARVYIHVTPGQRREQANDMDTLFGEDEGKTDGCS